MRSLRRRPLLPVVAALLVVTGACADEDVAGPEVVAGDDAGPSRSASPTPPPAPPSPDVTPVAGERIPGAHWVDSTGLLTQASPDLGPADTVLPFVHQVGDWLDAHLDDLQRGGAGRLDAVAAEGLVAAATAAELAAVTTALASPAAPVAAAVYRLDAAYAEDTEWLTATVEVVSDAGGTAAATLVFVPGDAGPELVLLGPADPVPVPS